jgi:hypothetical protein
MDEMERMFGLVLFVMGAQQYRCYSSNRLLRNRKTTQCSEPVVGSVRCLSVY